MLERDGQLCCWETLIALRELSLCGGQSCEVEPHVIVQNDQQVKQRVGANEFTEWAERSGRAGRAEE